MNDSDSRLDRILDEMYPDASEMAGPFSEDLQKLVRCERRRRYTARTVLAFAAVAVVGSFLGLTRSPAPTEIVAGGVEIEIQEVSDDGLFEIFEGTYPSP